MPERFITERVGIPRELFPPGMLIIFDQSCSQTVFASDLIQAADFAKMWWPFLLLTILRLPSTFSAYQLGLSVNPQCSLFWDVDYEQEKIIFEVHVKLEQNTWYSVGFSNYGEIYPSDLCTVWYDWKGRTILTDTWSDHNGTMHEDVQQDCTNFKYSEDGEMFKYTFSRKFDTCDNKDYVIDSGTTHIVWVTGRGPLVYLNGLSLHSASMSGFQRAQLIPSKVAAPVHPSDTWELEIRASETKIPNEETTYWCTVIQLPDTLRVKQHVIQYEPAIQKGNEHIVHHMEVFHCEAPADVKMPSYRGPCSSPSRPKSTEVCKRVIAAWAMGAIAFPYPEEAGLPIGGADYNKYVVLEIHYHNPELIAGVIDSSGIKISITPSLRKYDAGLMELGLEYTDKMAIPPKQDNFHLTGFCIMECTAVSLPKNGIVVFGSQLHTHLTGIRVYTKHVRNGIELPEMNRDNHYSQHFQQIRRLMRNVHIQKGDALITRCEHKTTDRENVTLGGFSITDEMCVNYIHYYPKVDLEVCKSAISEKELSNYFHFMHRYENQDTADPKGRSEKYKSIEWTPLRVAALQQLYDTGKLSMQCNQSSGERFPGNWEDVPNTIIELPMPTARRRCKKI